MTGRPIREGKFSEWKAFQVIENPLSSTNELLSAVKTLTAHMESAVLERLATLLVARVHSELLLEILSSAMLDTPAVLYLKMKVLQTAGQPQAADTAAQIVSRSSIEDPIALLEAAQILMAGEQYDLAAQALRSALYLKPSYVFFSRSEKLIRDVWNVRPPRLRKLKIAVLGSNTTTLLISVLRALCFRDGIDAEFYQGLYGAVHQEILDSSSGLYKFQPNLVIVMPSWREAFNLEPIGSDENLTIDRILERYVPLWAALSARCSCHIIQHDFDLPAHDPLGLPSTAGQAGRTRITRLLNLAMSNRAPSHVSVLDTDEVMRRAGSHWHNPLLWYTAQQHPAPAALPELAEAQMAHVRSVVGLTRKVLICDLDNTLWGGVIGEDGLAGIKLGPGSPVGEAHADLQSYLLDLRRRGILLAVCSRNNEEDAKLPFLQHPHSRLRLEDFSAFVANWDDKTANIRNIAGQLSLGTDSFVFLDDNPVERAWVRSQLPEVAVVDTGSSVFGYLEALDRGRYFYSLQVSQEDVARADRYRTQAAATALRQSTESAEAFLQSLQMTAITTRITADNISRVTQLLNKTNQFNLTTRRHTQSQVEAICSDRMNFTGVFQLSDRFGDHGIVGVMICRQVERGTWEIDSWLISCRVLGRQLECFMLNRVLQAAAEASVEKIVGVYRPTSKNSQVADLYSRLGFFETDSNSEETRYILTAREANTQPCFIEDRSPAEVKS
jgi:FkbH-like protein